MDSTQNVNDAEKKELTIEEGFAILDESIVKLSEENLSLEEAFAVYEKGVKILKEVNSKIEAVEKKVELINANGSRQDFT
ncbi:MAG: exodeoxyribonuclease VII small subunit [Lachnospiraceae bacterium]|nr:exodeoxyribonuclease VII small subunit [Lachnospiraceae bacterium]